MRTLTATAVLVAASLLLLNGCTTVNPGHVGIEVNKLGSQRGVGDFPQRTGLVFYNPLTTSIIEYPTFVQTAVWTHDTSEGHPTNEELTFTTKEGMIIHADVSLSYSLKQDQVPSFYVKFRSDDLQTFTHGFLRNVARDKFDEAGGHYSVEQIMGDNGPFIIEVRNALQKEVADYGVTIDQFGIIGAPRPPENVIQALNMKVQATQTALQKQNEVAQATADAQKLVAEAEGTAKAQITRAQGEAEANKLRNSAITENLLKMRQLDNEHDRIWRWNGQMPSVVSGGNNGLLMQLPKEN